MICPKCGAYENYRVIKTSKTHEQDVRKNECLSCGHTWPSITHSVASMVKMCLDLINDEKSKSGDI